MLSTESRPPDQGPQTSAAGDPVRRTPEDWAKLVMRIQSGDALAMEELYEVFAKGIRFFLCRQLGHQELDDKVHDTFLIVVQAIRRGELREPDRLMGFVRTIVRRQIAAYIDEAVQSRREQACIEGGMPLVDRRTNPEQGLMGRQREEIMLEVLSEMSTRDRDILTRFYLHEQPQEQICREMDLTDTQFRLLKSRAKARFGEMGRRKFRTRSLSNFFMRNQPGSTHLFR